MIDVVPEAERSAPAPLRDRLICLASHPLSVLWLLALIGIVGGLVEWLFLGGSPWEGLGAAGVIAGVTKIAARARRVHPWPWR